MIEHSPLDIHRRDAEKSFTTEGTEVTEEIYLLFFLFLCSFLFSAPTRLCGECLFLRCQALYHFRDLFDCFGMRQRTGSF
jgi:hypothetical protein